MKTLKHVGVKGMKWGVRKVVDSKSSTREIDYKSEGFVIRKGSDIHRLSSVSNETHAGSGYASFLQADSKGYQDMGKVFSKIGMQQYDMTLRAKKDLVSPSQRERVDTFLKKMEDPAFAKELAQVRSKMFIFNIPTPGDVQMAQKFKDVPFKKLVAYRALNNAISANKSLRAQYLEEFRKKNYDFILDEADSTNKVSTAPIIFINRKESLQLVRVDEL